MQGPGYHNVSMSYEWLSNSTSQFIVHVTMAPSQYKDSLSMHGDFHYKDMTSYLHNGNSYTDKTSFLYYDGPQGHNAEITKTPQLLVCCEAKPHSPHR